MHRYMAISFFLAAPSLSPIRSDDVGGATAVQMWTLVVAGLAVLATLASAYLLRRTGKGTVQAAKQAAAASERSAQAAEKSAEAALDSVLVNRDSAAGRAKQAESDAFTKRYHDAATQLGDPNSIVRLSGVFAMARLGDEWPERRQECVDVMCSYLRASSDSALRGNEDGANEQEVRASIVRSIAERLTESAAISWSNLKINLSKTLIDSCDFSNVRFNIMPRFQGCKFTGDCSFRLAYFAQGADFRDCDVLSDARLGLHGIRFDGTIWMRSLEVERMGEMVASFGLHGFGRQFDLKEAEIHGELRLYAGDHVAEPRAIGASGIVVHPTGQVVINKHSIQEPVHAAGLSVNIRGMRAHDGAIICISRDLLDADRIVFSEGILEAAVLL
jgi:hypothetical protein